MVDDTVPFDQGSGNGTARENNNTELGLGRHHTRSGMVCIAWSNQRSMPLHCQATKSPEMQGVLCLAYRFTGALCVLVLSLPMPKYVCTVVCLCAFHLTLSDAP